MAAPQPQLDYAAIVERYAPAVDATAVQGIVKYLSIALRNRDSSLVAASDPSELARVRDSFMKKKLGLNQTDADLDAALKDVMTTMSGERNKSRVTVYYLLAETFGKLGLFANPQAATAMQPTKGPAVDEQCLVRWRMKSSRGEVTQCFGQHLRSFCSHYSDFGCGPVDGPESSTPVKRFNWQRRERPRPYPTLKPGFSPNDLVGALNLEIINFPTGSAEIPVDSYPFLNSAAVAIKRRLREPSLKSVVTRTTLATPIPTCGFPSKERLP